MDSNLENHTQETKKKRGDGKTSPFFSNNNPKNRECGKLEFSTLFNRFSTTSCTKKFVKITNIQQFNKFSTKFSTEKKAINKRNNIKKNELSTLSRLLLLLPQQVNKKESEVSTGTR